jgi:uncharacterized membrane protein YjfL (UPF0719 family)
MDQLHHILHGLAYVALGVALLVLTRGLIGLISPYSLRDQLTGRDNAAAGLAFTGYLVGVIIIYLGAAIGPDQIEMADGAMLDPTWSEIGMSMLTVSGYTIGGLGCLYLGTIVVDKFVLRTFSVQKEIVEDRNVGTGAVIFGNTVATALIIAGAVHGEGGGPLSAIVFFLLGQVVLVIWSLFYQMITKFDLHEQIEKDNVAAGTAYGLSVIAIGIVLLRASMDDLVSWPDHLAKFGYFAVAGLIVITILRALTNRLLLPGTTLHMEIERDRNLNAAWIEGSVAIGAAATVFFML